MRPDRPTKAPEHPLRPAKRPALAAELLTFLRGVERPIPRTDRVLFDKLLDLGNEYDRV